MKRQITLFSIFVLLLTGCGQRSQKITITNRPLFEEIECVGILPFRNLSGNSAAASAITDILENEFVTAGQFQVMTAGEVDYALKKKRLSTSIHSDTAKIRQAGQVLGVQGILVGTVFDYGYRDPKYRGEEDPFVSFAIKLYHMPTGSIVWTSKVNRSSREFSGRNRDPLSRVAMLAAADLVEAMKKNLSNRKPINIEKTCGSWSSRDF